MREIHLLDTSVFCCILRVSGLCSEAEHQAALREVAALTSQPGITTTLLLPVATIYETGNHIAQNGDGDARRKAGLRFAKQVAMAFANKAPWTPTPLPSQEQMQEWLPLFPDYAMRNVSLGDLSIIKTFEQQCELNPLARVRICSYDKHLAGYDHRPMGSLAG